MPRPPVPPWRHDERNRRRAEDLNQQVRGAKRGVRLYLDDRVPPHDQRAVGHRDVAVQVIAVTHRPRQVIEGEWVQIQPGLKMIVGAEQLDVACAG
jgi:hypothetical protein